VTTEPTYIIDAGEEREPLAAWRLFTGGTPAQCLEHAGISWPAAWCLLRVTKPAALPGEDEAIFAGDIDVFVGRLSSEKTITAMSPVERMVHTFQHLGNGARFFPPEGDTLTFDLSYLVGMEVKCAYVGVEETLQGKRPVLKSLKASESKHWKLRTQLRSLLGLGFEKVFLLDVIGGIPSEAKTLDEVFAWTALSCSTVDAKHQRLTDGFARDLPIGHLEVTIGPERGYAENAGGFSRIGPKRIAPDNPLLADPVVAARRLRLVEHLKGVLNQAQSQIVHQIPVVLDRCPRCARVGVYHGTDCSV
jgi:hypothetical protein